MVKRVSTRLREFVLQQEAPKTRNHTTWDPSFPTFRKVPYRVSGDVLIVLRRTPDHQQAVLPHPPGYPHVQGPAQQPGYDGGGVRGQSVGQRDAAAAARGGLDAVARSEGGHGRDGRQAAGAARMK